MSYDSLVKNPSAALRGNFGKGAGGWVLGAGKNFVFGFLLHPTHIRYPHFLFLRALHCRGTLRVPDIGRDASRPYNRNHRSGDLLRK
jgi:hypothetical protein